MELREQIAGYIKGWSFHSGLDYQSEISSEHCQEVAEGIVSLIQPLIDQERQRVAREIFKELQPIIDNAEFGSKAASMAVRARTAELIRWYQDTKSKYLKENKCYSN